MTRGQRLGSLAVAAVIAVVAVMLLRPGSEEADPTRRARPQERAQPGAAPSGRPSPPRERAEPRPAYEALRFERGRPVGGARDITVKSGETVRLAVRSDRSEEFHIHGYDRYVRVEPGRVNRVSFPARLEGVFEIEAHSDGTLLANLRVEP